MKRELGVVGPETASTARAVVDEVLAARARELLREEVAALVRVREQLAAEEAGGATGSGRRSAALAASLEGASRFALRIGLVSPAEARAIWTELAVTSDLDIDRPREKPRE